MCRGCTHSTGLMQWPPFTRRSPSVLSNGIPLNKMTITKSNLHTLEKKPNMHDEDSLPGFHPRLLSYNLVLYALATTYNTLAAS